MLSRLHIHICAFLLLGFAIARAQFPAGADAFANATNIPSANDVSAPFDITGFGSEMGEPGVVPYGPSRSAWWRWTAPADGFLTVSTVLPTGLDAAASDTVIGVYRGVNVAQLSIVDDDDDAGEGRLSSVTVPVTGGFIYRIKADIAGNGADSGLVQLSLRFYQPEARTYTGALSFGSAAGQQFSITLTTTATGACSGKVKGLGSTLAFASFAGQARKVIVGLPEAGLETPISLEIDLAAGSGPLPVRVMTNVSTFTTRIYPRVAFTKQAPASVAGTFTARLFSTVGDGYVLGRISPSGRATFSGRTGDGVAIAFGGPLSALDSNDFALPIFVRLFANKGFLVGTLNFLETGSVDSLTAPGASIHYFRPPSSGTFLPSGVSVFTGIEGGTYTRPPAGQRAEGFLNGTNGVGALTVSPINGEFSGFAENLTLGTDNRFSFASQSRRPKLKLNPRTGLVTGSVEVAPGAKRALRGILARGPTLGIYGSISGTATNAAFTVAP